jgi:hypothetical protein
MYDLTLFEMVCCKLKIASPSLSGMWSQEGGWVESEEKCPVGKPPRRSPEVANRSSHCSLGILRDYHINSRTQHLPQEGKYSLFTLGWCRGRCIDPFKTPR